MSSERQTAGRQTNHKLWMTLVAAFLGWMFDGMEMGIFPLVARPALQNMLGVPPVSSTPLSAGTGASRDKATEVRNENGTKPTTANESGDKLVGKWMGYVTALFLLGAAAGGLVFGWLGDRVGRVRAMSLSILTYSLFTGACYFATEPWHLGVLRFIAALGMGGEWSLGVALVMECWPEKHRPWLAGAIGAASNVGFLLIGTLTWLYPITSTSWRWVMMVGAAPALLTFFIRLFVPESERWKESVSASAAHPVKEIFSPALFKTTLLAICFASIALIGTWGSVQWIPLWADQMTQGKEAQAKAMAGIASSIGAILGCIVGPLIGGSIGRRPTYFLLCLLSLASCAWLFRTFDSYGLAFLAVVLLVGAATASFYGWLPLYLPELFPTRVRATGQGLSFNFGRILAAAGALLQGELIRQYDGSYARAGATITLIYAAGLILIWFAPETRGRPLPE